MHCQYCGSINGEDDHRCLRCGRRITGIAISAPTSYIGATALAVSAMPERELNFAAEQSRSPEQPALFQQAWTPPQPSWTSEQKIIPFEQIQRHAAARIAPTGFVPQAPPGAASSQKPPSPPRAPSKRQVPQPAGQGSLDLRSGSSQSERILATGVPAQVYGDGRVAPPMRRVTAGAMDVSMVLLGFGVFALTARFGGSMLGFGAAVSFGAGRALWLTLSLSMILISLFYGLVWAMASRETAGMNWTQLRLVSFDGSPLDGRNRAIRFVSAWLSYCSGGLGLLWALADEENLAFHDHISKTYPAEKGTTGKSAPRRR